MKTILHIISKPAESWENYPFVLSPSPNQGSNTVVLLEGVAGMEKISADHIYQVNEGPPAEVGSVDSTQSPTSISYRNLLDLIFASDTSIVF